MELRPEEVASNAFQPSELVEYGNIEDVTQASSSGASSANDTSTAYS